MWKTLRSFGLSTSNYKKWFLTLFWCSLLKSSVMKSSLIKSRKQKKDPCLTIELELQLTETWKRWSNDREFSRDPSRQCANNIPLLTSACAVVAKCKKSDIDPFAMSWLYNSCMCACFHWRLVQWGIVCVALLKYTIKAVTINLWLSVLYKGQFNAHLWNWTCWTLQKRS